jgi:hypothetical protein
MPLLYAFRKVITFPTSDGAEKADQAGLIQGMVVGMAAYEMLDPAPHPSSTLQIGCFVGITLNGSVPHS